MSDSANTMYLNLAAVADNLTKAADDHLIEGVLSSSGTGKPVRFTKY